MRLIDYLRDLFVEIKVLYKIIDYHMGLVNYSRDLCSVTNFSFMIIVLLGPRGMTERIYREVMPRIIYVEMIK